MKKKLHMKQHHIKKVKKLFLAHKYEFKCMPEN